MSWVFPHIELDAIHWLPNWRERPTVEFRELAALAVAGDQWVTGPRVKGLKWKAAPAARDKF